MGKKRRNETEEERKERKRAKKEAKKKKKKKKKKQKEHKTIESLSFLKEASNSDHHPPPSPVTSLTPSEAMTQCTAFQQKRLKMVVSLFPVALSDIRSHVRESLRSLLLKYSDGIGGVLLGFDKIKFSNDDPCGVILNELPHIHYNVELDALVFCPEVGSKVRLCSSA